MVLRIRHKSAHKNADKEVVKDKAILERQDLENILNDENANIESIRVRYDFEQAAELAPSLKPAFSANTTKNIVEKVAHDTFTTGAIAGILGTVVLHALGIIWKYLGLLEITTLQIAGEIFLNPNQINTFAGFVVSMISHFVVGSAGGVLLAFFMKIFGHDFYWFKGLALAGFMLLTGMGLIVNIMDIATDTRKDAVTILFYIAQYVAYGLLVSYIIFKFAQIRKTQS